jgi:hypothetical protein
MTMSPTPEHRHHCSRSEELARIPGIGSTLSAIHDGLDVIRAKEDDSTALRAGKVAAQTAFVIGTGASGALLLGEPKNV